MLASTVQFSNNNQPPATPTPHQDARNTEAGTPRDTTPTTTAPTGQNPLPAPAAPAGLIEQTARHHTRQAETLTAEDGSDACPYSQTPNSALTSPPEPSPPPFHDHHTQPGTRKLQAQARDPETRTQTRRDVLAISTKGTGPHRQTETVNVPPMSRQHRTSAGELALPEPTHPTEPIREAGSLKCSLERR
jgi:hypothetical protein